MFFLKCRYIYQFTSLSVELIYEKEKSSGSVTRMGRIAAAFFIKAVHLLL